MDRKAYARHVMAQGKLGASAEGKRMLHRAGALSRGGSVDSGRFAKAILMADGGEVEAYDDDMESPEDYLRVGEGSESWEKIKKDHAAEIKKAAKEARDNIASTLASFQLPRDEALRQAMAFRNLTNLYRQMEKDPESVRLDLLLALRGDKSMYVDFASDPKRMSEFDRRIDEDSTDQGLEQLSDEILDPESNFNKSVYGTPAKVNTSGSTGSQMPLRQYTDDRGITHLTNRTQPMMRRENGPPAPDVDAMMYGSTSGAIARPGAPARPATPASKTLPPQPVTVAPQGPAPIDPMRNKFVKAIRGR